MWPLWSHGHLRWFICISVLATFVLVFPEVSTKQSILGSMSCAEATTLKSMIDGLIGQFN